MPARQPVTDSPNEQPDPSDLVNTRLNDALERVAHGATVSVPVILLAWPLEFAFTAILTNGFGANLYGIFVLADRLQSYVVNLLSGFLRGFNRYLPTASSAEQDLLTTFVSLLLLGIATVFGIGLFIFAPLVKQLGNHGPQLQRFIRIYAVGLPVTIWFHIVLEILRSFEEVSSYNLVRVGLPTAQLIAAGLATFIFHDMILVIGGMLATTGLVGITTAAWLVRKRGISLRITKGGGSTIRRRYVEFTIPLFVGRFARTTQQLGFYPLIALFLSDIAGAIFAIGILVGSLVRMPLMGINQFLPPVAAALHEENHREALRRLYQVMSRLVLMCATALAIPLIVYRTAVMDLFGPMFVRYAPLLLGFIVGQYAACVAGSGGILLAMMDHQRALLVVNVAITAIMVSTAIPLTILFDLPGLVTSYFLMVIVNKVVQVGVLYHLEGMQPFTRLHAKPLLAAVPLLLITLVGRVALPTKAAPLFGTLVGLAAYAGMLSVLGFTQVERHLARSLVNRYRETLSTSIW